MAKWEFSKPTICIDVPPEENLLLEASRGTDTPDDPAGLQVFRELAGESLGSSEFQWLLQSVYDAVLITAPDGRIRSLNARAIQFFRCEPAYLTARNILDLISGAHADLLLTIRENIGQDRFALIQAHCVREDSTSFPAEISVNLLTLQETDYLCFFIRDITRRKQAERKLERYAIELKRRNIQLEEDLDMACDIQMALMPRHYPVFPEHAVPGEEQLHFAHRYCPSGILGGDFFSVFPVSPTRAGLFIADVAGHGMRAALVVAMMRGLLEQMKEARNRPDQLLTALNAAHTGIFAPAHESMFVTAFYGVLDITDGTLAYATAGHPLPYLLRRKQQQVEALKFPDAGAHPALGLFDDSVYEACTLELSAGDLLLLYTDGVTEARNEEGEDYTPERLVKSLHKRWNETPQQLLHRLTDDIRRFIGAGDFQDDVCLLAVEYSGCRADGTP